MLFRSETSQNVSFTYVIFPFKSLFEIIFDDFVALLYCLKILDFLLSSFCSAFSFFKLKYFIINKVIKKIITRKSEYSKIVNLNIFPSFKLIKN